MQRRKIIVDNDTYETLKAFRMIFKDASRKGFVSDDLILMAAFNALADKMHNAFTNELKENNIYD